ncbi:MAG: GNAT family N-acetyltransferase [Alteromonadaceae bacterium]|nr:GNAT family N-acetyltransferase [Alteromonadaceae bacterium]
MSEHRIVNCTFEKHGEEILSILNEVIVSSTAIYDYEQRTIADIAKWFQSKKEGGFPVLGLEAASGELVAFASYGSFRNWPAYKFTIEHSIYVKKGYRGFGFGDAILSSVVDDARKNGFHALIGGIDIENTASIKFHEKHGFVNKGTLKEVGYKFNRWLDLGLYQLIL